MQACWRPPDIGDPELKRIDIIEHNNLVSISVQVIAPVSTGAATCLRLRTMYVVDSPTSWRHGPATSEETLNSRRVNSLKLRTLVDFSRSRQASQGTKPAA